MTVTHLRRSLRGLALFGLIVCGRPAHAQLDGQLLSRVARGVVDSLWTKVPDSLRSRVAIDDSAYAMSRRDTTTATFARSIARAFDSVAGKPIRRLPSLPSAAPSIPRHSFAVVWSVDSVWVRSYQLTLFLTTSHYAERPKCLADGMSASYVFDRSEQRRWSLTSINSLVFYDGYCASFH